jgi:glycerate-2-kinase
MGTAPETDDGTHGIPSRGGENDRLLLLNAFLAGVGAVDPGPATATAGEAVLGDVAGRVLLIAAGKASIAMARGLSGAAAIDDGIVVAPSRGDVPVPVIVGGHPLPDDGSVAGARRALAIARSAGEGDIVVCLISGGASALLAAPADGLTPADLRVANRTLIACGADIREINAVRKHLSAIKGGRLAAAAGRARLVTLLVSDVAGDPVDVIASGPTVPDPTTYADAVAVVDRYELRSRLPGSVVRHLEAGANGERPETPVTPHPDHHLQVIASGGVAAGAAVASLRSAGIPARLVSTGLAGEAGEAAVEIVRRAYDGTVLVYAGETTVTVAGRGRGGRNQQAALAAAIAVEGRPVTFLAAGTDGIDGPTDAAGGLVDGTTVERGAAAGLDARSFLADNDAHTFLAATGDLVVTGPTGTNVADLWLVRGPGAGAEIVRRDATPR